MRESSLRAGAFRVAGHRDHGGPPSLKPLYLQGRDAEDVGALGYSGLTTYDRRGAIVADVATVVPTMANGGISRDGKRIVFHLRRDITWQDGYPLTARDVVFSYRANTNPSNATPSQSFDTGIARVWAPDSYTVVVELARPQAAFVTSFFGGDGGAILPAHLLAAYPNLNHVAFNGAPMDRVPTASRSGYAAIVSTSAPTTVIMGRNQRFGT